MTEQEMVKVMEICKNKEIPCDDCPLVECGDCGEISRQYFYDRFKQLQFENAAMRKQISEMLTPPCTLGDKLYHYELSFGEGFDENGKVIYTSSMDIIETEVTRDNIWVMFDLVQNKRAFFSREALAASFKERFQKGREQFVKEIKDDKRRTD